MKPLIVASIVFALSPQVSSAIEVSPLFACMRKNSQEQIRNGPSAERAAIHKNCERLLVAFSRSDFPAARRCPTDKAANSECRRNLSHEYVEDFLRYAVRR